MFEQTLCGTNCNPRKTTLLGCQGKLVKLLTVIKFTVKLLTTLWILFQNLQINSLVDKGQLWRLATSSFLHANIGHLMVWSALINLFCFHIDVFMKPRLMYMDDFLCLLRLIVILWTLLVLPWRRSVVLGDILHCTLSLQLQVTEHHLYALTSDIAYNLVFLLLSFDTIRFNCELLVLQGAFNWCIWSNFWTSKWTLLLMTNLRVPLDSFCFTCINCKGNLCWIRILKRESKSCKLLVSLSCPWF